MTDLGARETSFSMEGNPECFRSGMQPDTTSGGRLLSASEDSRANPGFKMTRPAKRRVRIVLIVMLFIILAAFITIVAILASGRTDSTPGSTPKESEEPMILSASHHHIRCKDNVTVSNTASQWRHWSDRMPEWRQLPDIKHGGFVIVSPVLKLEQGGASGGVLLSMRLPGNNTRFHVVALTIDKKKKTIPRVLNSGNRRCDSVAINDEDFFKDGGNAFRIYVFYKRHFRLHGIKATVTSLPRLHSYKALGTDEVTMATTSPDFAVVGPGTRDHCSLEIMNRENIDCDWWNIEGGDAGDFVLTEGSNCIKGGTKSDASASSFLKLQPSDDLHEARALLISPRLRQDAPSVTLTFWLMLKCQGLEIRVHRVPWGSGVGAMDASSVVATISSRPNHLQWEFRAFEIPLPGSHSSYQLVLEGVIPANASCEDEKCGPDSVNAGKKPKLPTLAIDSLTLELFYERCPIEEGSDVMDCSFQTNSSDATLCEWKSSFPAEIPRQAQFPSFSDWKSESSGTGTSHGATQQHLEGRGRILTFDPSGKAGHEPYLRTPLVVASENCSCLMNLTYLMRGLLTPRLQVNLLYGSDTSDENREKEAQWSLFGHQSEDWQTALIPLNMRRNSPFQIEVRARNVAHAVADLHIDDIVFEGCAMKKT